MATFIYYLTNYNEAWIGIKVYKQKILISNELEPWSISIKRKVARLKFHSDVLGFVHPLNKIRKTCVKKLPAICMSFAWFSLSSRNN